MNRITLIIVSLIIVIVVGLFFVIHANAASSGPNLPTSVIDTMNCLPDGVWTNPTNIELADGNFAVSSPQGNGCGNTDDLTITGFGFSIPAGATINGITVLINRKQGALGVGKDLNVQLLKAGVNVGTNKASATQYPTTVATATYGSSVDLWGTAWTASDINNSNFGLDYAGGAFSSATVVISVDFVEITVTYTVSTAHGAVTVKQSRVFIGKSRAIIN